jgi:capsular exopolysaccharide synthesis family protein
MESIEKALKKARVQENALASGLSEVADQTTRVVPVNIRVLRNNRIVAGIAREPEADLYRMLRAQVLQRLAESGGSTLGICSPGPEAGKTLTAANLAVSMSLDANHTVLLVDLDLRKPSLAQRFGLKVSTGLSDYLFGQVQLSECLINPGIERLILLPGGNAIHNSSEALTSPQMTKLAQELKVRYPDRFVIYDLPPLLSSDDAMVFLPQIDATLLVVREGTTRTGDIQRSVNLLKDTNLIGTVLNGSAEENFFPYF